MNIFVYILALSKLETLIQFFDLQQRKSIVVCHEKIEINFLNFVTYNLLKKKQWLKYVNKQTFYRESKDTVCHQKRKISVT